MVAPEEFADDVSTIEVMGTYVIAHLEDKWAHIRQQWLRVKRSLCDPASIPRTSDLRSFQAALEVSR